jgi:hypothetical protein
MNNCFHLKFQIELKDILLFLYFSFYIYIYMIVQEIGRGGGEFRLHWSDRGSWSDSGSKILGSIKCENFLTSWETSSFWRGNLLGAVNYVWRIREQPILKYSPSKVKLDVQFSCANKEAIWGNGGISGHILNLATRWSEGSLSPSGSFVFMERSPIPISIETRWSPEPLCIY